MIPWKRSLGWILCAVLVAVLVAAPVGSEEPEMQALDAAESPAPAESAETAAASDAPAEPAAEPSDALAEPAAEPSDAPAEPAAEPSDAPAEPAAEPMGADAAATEDAPAAIADDAAMDEPAETAMDEPVAMEGAEMPAAEPADEPTLGAVAWDSAGREGRIHVVAPGDTLWAISDAYLDTPWVWPSIWKENEGIRNPHLIHPGDHIWITDGEMRRLTPEEADAMLTNGPPVPAEMAPAAAPDLDPEPEVLAFAPEEARTVRVAALESVGLISPDEYNSAASIVARVPERLLLSQEDLVYIGLGEGEVEVGDEFSVVRTNDKVVDPDTKELLGYHVDVIGWLRVEETFAETSSASVRMSSGEIEEGDRVVAREPVDPEVAVSAAPDGVEGKISFFPAKRVLMGFGDFVYLNRGELDGLEVGSPLEVYRKGFPAREQARDEWVEVPDRVIGKMLVVRTQAASSVALVMTADQELELGDRFRGARE